MSEISSVKLNPIGIIEGFISTGSFIINDYILEVINDNDEFVLKITKGSQVQEIHLTNGVGVQSIDQTDESDEDGGTNTMVVTLTDGTQKEFSWKNGSKGDKGDPGMTSEEVDAISNAESLRKLAENERIENELARKLAEQNRQRDETLRDNDEAERVSQEKIRASAEQTRISQEQTRVVAEIERNSNETNRQEAEANRTSGERNREYEWSVIKQETYLNLVRISDALEASSEATSEANDATQLAVDAYVNANKKAVEMQETIENVPSIVDESVATRLKSMELRIDDNGFLEYLNLEDE